MNRNAPSRRIQATGCRGAGSPFRALLFPLVLALCFALLPVARAQTVVGRISRPDWHPTALALYEAGNRLFVFDDNSNTIFAFDTTTLAEKGSVAIGIDEVYDMQVDESRGKLYAACSGLTYYCVHNGLGLAVVDARTNTLLANIYTGGGENRLVKDDALDRMYLTYNGGAFSIDVATDTMTPLAGITGNVYSSLAVNPVTHELFISNWSQNNDVLYVVNGTTLAVSKVPDMAGFGVGVNWLENKAYVSYCKSAGWEGFCIYDRKTGDVTRFYADNDSSVSMVFNPATNRMHSSAEVDWRTTIIEGATDAWFNVDLGDPAIPGVRASTGHVYYVAPSATYVMDGASTRLAATIPVAQIQYNAAYHSIVFNQTSGLVYVINDDDPAVTVIQDGCAPSVTSLCLNGSRFRLSVAWKNPYDGGSTGVGTVMPLTSDTGAFWFFSASNLELVVKVLDGRSTNGRFWVFYGALSDVEYSLTVTDTQTGAVKTYLNPPRNLASVADVNAF